MSTGYGFFIREDHRQGGENGKRRKGITGKGTDRYEPSFLALPEIIDV